MPATSSQLADLESSDRRWRYTLFPEYHQDRQGHIVPDADFHREFWDWLWAIKPGQPADAFIGVWFRGGGKSTSAEMGTAALGVRGVRSYGWYVSNTQRNADDHVANIASMLESPRLATFYPDHSRRMLGKFGSVRGWRRNRLRTAGGFTVDALGLDTAVRGAKLEQRRPDFIVIDDVDDKNDTAKTIAKKIAALTEDIIPAGGEDVVVLAIQNLIHPDSIFSQIVDGRAEMLFRRQVSGPVPAFRDLELEQEPEPQPGSTKREWFIAGGYPTWPGFSYDRAEALLNLIGPTAFNQECQHLVKPPAGGVFSHLDLKSIRVDRRDVPELVRAAVWCDPAVTSTDNSDRQAIQADGLGVDGFIYRLYSYEQRSTPVEALTRAISKAIELGADTVGVETDQGGDTWESVWREAVDKVTDAYTEIGRPVPYIPRYASAKAGAGYGPKTHRAQQMLTTYENDGFRHVRGTHTVLEAALWRFPLTKPWDLVDACFWSWNDLRELDIVADVDDDPMAIAAAVTAKRPSIFD